MTELIAAIQEWVSTGVSVPVQLRSLVVEEFCVIPSSTPLEQCPDAITTTMSSSMTPVTITSSDQLTLTISIAVGAILLMLLLVVAVVIVLVMFLKRRHHCSSLALAKDSESQ